MMSKEDEIFDNFLRSKFESKSFENKAHYWRNAQEMIAKERKSNNFFAPVIIASVVLVSAIALGFLFTSTHSSAPVASNTLTASVEAAGVTHTNTTAVLSSSDGQLSSSQQPAGNNISSTQQAATNLLPQQNNTPQTTATSTYVSAKAKDRKPKRQKRLKSMDEPVVSAISQPVKENTQPQVIDINGKTLIVPFDVTTKEASFSKTNAYVAHAAKDQKNFFALEAGATFYNPGNAPANALNGHIGFRYYRFLSPKFAVSTGLTYVRLHQNLPTRSYQSTDYDFGVNASAVNITTQRLDYIELPVSVMYKIAPKHYITTGASVGYVLQSSDKITNNLTGDRSVQSGYLKAINHWDAQFNIGYQYHITPNLWIRASYHMGVMDISDNTLFKRTETNINKGLRLTIGYKVH